MRLWRPPLADGPSPPSLRYHVPPRPARATHRRDHRPCPRKARPLRRRRKVPLPAHPGRPRRPRAHRRGAAERHPRSREGPRSPRGQGRAHKGLYLPHKTPPPRASPPHIPLHLRRLLVVCMGPRCRLPAVAQALPFYAKTLVKGELLAARPTLSPSSPPVPPASVRPAPRPIARQSLSCSVLPPFGLLSFHLCSVRSLLAHVH